MNKIKKKREELGWSRAKFSREFEIPLRTVEGWELGERTCPSYTEKLILEKLEIIKNSK